MQQRGREQKFHANTIPLRRPFHPCRSTRGRDDGCSFFPCSGPNDRRGGGKKEEKRPRSRVARATRRGGEGYGKQKSTNGQEGKDEGGEERAKKGESEEGKTEYLIYEYVWSIERAREAGYGLLLPAAGHTEAALATRARCASLESK